jgi:hypothetical protein
MSSLNICGLSSVTDVGTTAICANCWKMAHLNFEDVYLLADRSFYFDRLADGRVAADENMLKGLTTLNLKDCVHISDRAIEGLQKRCGKIETLNLQGCHKLSDRGLAAMYECVNDSTNQMFPMCDSFRTLTLASCTNFTASGLASLFPRCGVLENLDLSGITAVSHRGPLRFLPHHSALVGEALRGPHRRGHLHDRLRAVAGALRHILLFEDYRLCD